MTGADDLFRLVDGLQATMTNRRLRQRLHSPTAIVTSSTVAYDNVRSWCCRVLLAVATSNASVAAISPQEAVRLRKRWMIMCRKSSFWRLENR